MTDDDSENSNRHLTSFLKKPRILITIIKVIGIVVTLLTLGAFLVGYGIWIGRTETTIGTIKDNLRDLKDEDLKTSKNLGILVERLNGRLQDIEIILTKQQSSITALHTEIRIRHEEPAYIRQMLDIDASDRLSKREMQRLEDEARHNAQVRAAKASDIAIDSADKTMPVLADDPLGGLSF